MGAGLSASTNQIKATPVLSELRGFWTVEKREEKPLNGRERQKFEPVTALRGKKAAEREEGKEVEFFFKTF